MIYSLEEFEKFDNIKSKVLKYVLYKKRTEQEIRQKFSKDIDKNTLEDIIEELKENSYIDDYNYIDRTVNEFINLKSLSIKEIIYKLYSKGIKNDIVEDYIYKNKEKLYEYENNSACRIYTKKSNSMDKYEIKAYLTKKGYSDESISYALTQE